jgi:hypothetical protein
VKIIATILDIITALLHVLEVEGRMLRRSVMRLGWALAFMVVASLLALAAAGFFLLAIYQYVAAQMSPVVASLAVSFLALVLALLFAGLAKSRTR